MSSIASVVTQVRKDSSRFIAPVCAALLGVVLIYLAGFAHADALHDGAHDARHSASFPCH